MAIFKCKMCGGTLEISNETVATCEYCGTQQTLPTALDENLQGLFNRANALRMKSEFDKAEQLYEKILQADETQAEAYWGLILCKYGIEYVEDPQTFKRVPTCHRASFDSIVADSDYKSALQYADALQKDVYRQEATEIECIQKEIVELSSKEEPYDVFICYKETDPNGTRTQDSVIANDIYYQLKNEGFKVFYAAITLEDKLGSAYEPCIFAALNSAKVMLAIGTKAEYFNAVWVKNEWSRFLKIMKKDRSKILIPCYKDMDAYDLPEEFAHLQAQDMGKIGFINDLIRGVKKVLHTETPKAASTSAVNQPANISQLMLEDETMYEGETFAGIPHGHGKATYKFGEIYEGEWNRGKRHGHGKIVYKNGAQWEGEWKDDKKWSGAGWVYYDDACYEGAFKDGQEYGYGKLIWNKGGQWEGQWKDGKRWEGTGIWYWNDGYYEGETKEGNRCGHGKFVWNEGGQWEGEWRDDKRWEGTGVLYYKDGYFEGEIKEGNRHGYGKYVWNTGDFYEGEWKNDNRTGHGKYVWNTGGVYEGEWVDGNRSGQGKQIWDKGTQWEGQWKGNNCWEGTGVLYYKDGYYEGETKEGNRCGHGKFVWNEGGQWEGEWRDDKRWEGTGVLYYKDGYFEGEIKEGNRHGYGKYVWNNGDVYEGTYKDNVKNGYGKYIYKDGTRWEGEWKNGNPWTGNGTWTQNGTRFTGKWKDGNVYGGCYVATCVYGSYDCPEVWTLRRFRDDMLATTWHGRAFIRLYYKVSPKIVKTFGDTKWFKKLWKKVLDKKVASLQRDGVEFSPYEDKNW